MKILITGSTGMIGTALIEFLQARGHEITRVVRAMSQSSEPAVRWDPATGELNAKAIEGFDAAVHLAGESIAAGRWTTTQKARILDSRVKGTRLLSETLAKLAKPPKVLVSASAIGYYGHRGDEILREESASGSGFLSEVCRQWEKAADPVRQKGIRVVHPRMGVILSQEGGALAKMLLPFKLGLGGISMSHTVACASSAIAIGEAFRRVRSGEATVMVTGAGNSRVAVIVAGPAVSSTLSAEAARPAAGKRKARPLSRASATLPVASTAMAVVMFSLLVPHTKVE